MPAQVSRNQEEVIRIIRYTYTNNVGNIVILVLAIGPAVECHLSLLALVSFV